MNLRDRFRRWWRPAAYYDDHPLTDVERHEIPNPHIAENIDITVDEVPGAGGPGVVPHIDDEFRRP
jgi:hypothetical protein